MKCMQARAVYRPCMMLQSPAELYMLANSEYVAQMLKNRTSSTVLHNMEDSEIGVGVSAEGSFRSQRMHT